VDFHDPAFWQKGFDELHALVDRAEALAASLAQPASPAGARPTAG